MSDKDAVFLTPQEALAAIRQDLAQYAPQNELFCELGPLILDTGTAIREDPRHGGLWIGDPDKGGLDPIGAPELVQRLWRTLERSAPSLDLLTDLCRRVFRAEAWVGRPASDQPRGIWIKTGMEDFSCRNCGRCCRCLRYHDQLTAKDYRRFQAHGRTDILQWIECIQRRGRIVAYRIWVQPGTRRLAEGCPWLRQMPVTGRWECRIHDVKPEICRQYPGSRKHALMTGCMGFGD
jgi:Fe-S-cluster containining protein